MNVYFGKCIILARENPHAKISTVIKVQPQWFKFNVQAFNRANFTLSKFDSLLTNRFDGICGGSTLQTY